MYKGFEKSYANIQLMKII